LTAVYNLKTFTVSELCRAAGLDRDQAYTQLKKLTDANFLEKRTMPSGTDAHAPIKEYKLLDNPETQQRFAQELALYQMPTYELGESELAKVALQDATQGLDRIDLSLEGIERDRSDNALHQLDDLDSEYSTAWTNIETARLEYSGNRDSDEALPRSVKKVIQRWKDADARRAKLREELLEPKGLDWGPMLRTAAEFVLQHAISQPAIAPGSGWVTNLAKKFLHDFTEDYRAPIEVLLDEIRANGDYPFEPVFRHALRTKNAEVLFDIVQILKFHDVPWWQYNRENAAYLKTSKLHVKSWLMAYRALQRQLTVQKEMHFVVYSCSLDKLTREVYLDVTRGRCVSLVSSREVGFLGASEIIKPTLVIENGNFLKSLDCSFLRPEVSFYAYGPIANDVILWQGAPDLRVAACLGMWGLSLEQNLSKIITPLNKDRALLVIQGETPCLPSDAAGIIEAEEIVESVAG
jgi:hypothetical protein